MVSRYAKKMAKKFPYKYIQVEEIHLGDFKAKLSPTDDGFVLRSENGSLYISDGQLHISGSLIFELNTKTKLEKPKISGATGYLTVKVNGKKKYIPLFDSLETKI